MANKGRTGGNTRSNTARAKSGRNASGNRIDNTYTRQRKNAAKQALDDPENARSSEIMIFVYLAVAVFLLCSNFGWCGVVGDFISKIIFGLLGTVTYIVPIYLFFSAAFLLSNGAHKKIIKRVLCVGIFLIVIAFICQLISGTSGMGIGALYKDGANYKKGGGVILGGLLVLLHKLTGTTGSIIVIVLLTIIGIIIVMDVSILDMLKNSLSKGDYDEDDDDESFESPEKTRRHNKNTNVLDNIRVLEAPESKTKNSKRKKNKVVEAEEVHELKPLDNGDIFGFDSSISENKDFFDVKSVSDIPVSNKIDDEFNKEYKTDTEEVTDLTPIKRKRKKTKETEAEMLDAVEEVSKDIEAVTSSEEKTAREVFTEYRFPPIDLLKTAKSKVGVNQEQSVRETAMKLKSTLENFGVNVTITDYSCGPSVTRYELQPEQGVKVSKIVNLADDIKLNLAAADIRIEAPIPGKAAIGIEVPNKEASSVYFRDLLESDNFKKYPSNIAFAVGKDIGGQVIVADIAKMPHLLVAGATGSGKSVCINTLIMSILYKAKPDDVKLIMVDPKQVELSIYNGIPHMLIPVVTDPKKAAGALNWAVLEMTNRYQLFAQYNVRNLQGYNEKVKEVTGDENGNEDLKKLPQIVIIVDELADLMMVAHGEVEDAIVRLSQLARAAGIHLVIATQRPSVDVITGLIKANVPSRIAMTVSSGVDSRTILDMNGAEKLLGKGDMLFYPTGYPKPVRVQGAFLSDDEIANVVNFLKSQNGETKYDEKITQEIASTAVGSGAGGASADSDVDEYFADAGKFIIGKDKASIGMLQRVYKIGFNRAARIMDQLADAGVVGPEEGTKPRKVLMTMEEFENYVEENL